MAKTGTVKQQGGAAKSAKTSEYIHFVYVLAAGLYMKKKFYIVPTTGTYYDICESETREEALCDFTDKMADDMSAYFVATDKEPVQYPHGYKKPKNRFERAMSVIVASVAMDTQSPFYRDNVIGHMDMSNMGVVACLQKAYDMAKASPGQTTVKCRKRFYKILRDITGFELENKNCSQESAGPSKIYVSRDRQSAAYKCLDHDHIQYDLDEQGNIIVDGAYLNLALMHIRSMGIEAELVNGKEEAEK